MPIASGDILVKLSAPAGTVGNGTAQASVDASLGKYMSSTQLTNNTLHNLFTAMTGDNNAGQIHDYRCIFFHNNHASLSMISPRVWISSEVAGGADTYIGLDPSGVSSATNAQNQATFTTLTTGIPAGVTFTNPTVKISGLAPADVPASSCFAIWVKRFANNSVAVNSDGATLKIEFDTEA